MDSGFVDFSNSFWIMCYREKKFRKIYVLVYRVRVVYHIGCIVLLIVVLIVYRVWGIVVEAIQFVIMCYCIAV